MRSIQYPAAASGRFSPCLKFCHMSQSRISCILIDWFMDQLKMIKHLNMWQYILINFHIQFGNIFSVTGCCTVVIKHTLFNNEQFGLKYTKMVSFLKNNLHFYLHLSMQSCLDSKIIIFNHWFIVWSTKSRVSLPVFPIKLTEWELS